MPQAYRKLTGLVLSGRTSIRRPRSSSLTAAWFGIVLIALALRLGWALGRPVDTAALDRLPDQQEYLQLGRNLLRHGSLSFVDPRFDQTVYAFRMPGYPVLVAACAGDVRVIRVAQAVIDTSTVWAAGALATEIFGDAAIGCAAAAIVAVNPFLIYFCGLVLSDSLFAALVAWAVLLLQKRRTVAGGALLVLGAMVRPTGLGLLLLLPGLTALAFDRSVLSAVRATAIVAVLAAAAFIPWAVRNHMRLNAWVFTTTNAGFTLYDGFHDGATGASDQRFVATLPALQKMGEVPRSDLLAGQAKTWIGTHPALSIRLAVQKLLRFWSPVPLSAEFNHKTYVLAGGIYSVCLYALVAASLWRRRCWRSLACVGTVAIYFSMVHACTVGSLRYRLPLESSLAAVAGAARRKTQTPGKDIADH